MKPPSKEKSLTIQLRCKAQWVRAAKAAANLRGISLSEFIRGAVTEKIEKNGNIS